MWVKILCSIYLLTSLTTNVRASNAAELAVHPSQHDPRERPLYSAYRTNKYGEYIYLFHISPERGACKTIIFHFRCVHLLGLALLLMPRKLLKIWKLSPLQILLTKQAGTNTSQARPPLAGWPQSMYYDNVRDFSGV